VGHFEIAEASCNVLKIANQGPTLDGRNRIRTPSIRIAHREANPTSAKVQCSNCHSLRIIQLRSGFVVRDGRKNLSRLEQQNIDNSCMVT
jgi:hypothetical protein